MALLYAALGLAWSGFAGGIVPPWLAAERPGPLVEALKRFLHVPPAGFLRHDLPGRWRELWTALLIALALHAAIVAVLARDHRRAPDEERSRCVNIVLGILAAAFLGVAAFAPPRQDYYLYLEIWYHIQQGYDPWFVVPSANGTMPLNAYGPLFNLMAGPAWMNPAAPRLILSAAYILFAIAMTRSVAAGRAPSPARTLGVFALLWNPFAWIEVGFYGHLDILVGLACLGAVRALAAGRDIRSGSCLAAGVLLKYLPIVLLPFLALEPGRSRPRFRFLAAALAGIALGLGASALIWGPSTFAPLVMAVSRRPEALSIFRFIGARYSPFVELGLPPNYGQYIPIAQLLGLGAVWCWSLAATPDLEAAALAAVLTLLLLYPVGYPQYQMVPFVLASAWLLRGGDHPAKRRALAIAMTVYFGWIAAYDVAYVLHDTGRLGVDWDGVQDAVGLPTFLLGSLLLGCVIRAAGPGTPGSGHLSHPSGTME